MRRLVLFDLDDTLVDRAAAFRAWAHEFVIAQRLDDAALAYLLETDAAHSGPMDSFFTTVGRSLDLSTPPAQLWAQYRHRMPELASCRPIDLDALRRLSDADWRIGIVTNGMADNQLAKIHNTGLDRLMDGWCISGEVGIRKPHPEIFHLTAERCGHSAPTDGWMVGDSLDLDIAGGQAAGLRTIWLQPNQPASSCSFAGPKPDVTVGSVVEAIDILLESS